MFASFSYPINFAFCKWAAEDPITVIIRVKKGASSNNGDQAINLKSLGTSKTL